MRREQDHRGGTTIKTVRLPSGQALPVLGQGTWGMGEARAKRHTEIAALRLGLDLGMTLIDTAEMYGEGGAEDVIGEAIGGRRADVYLSARSIRTTRHGTARSRRASAASRGSRPSISTSICCTGADRCRLLRRWTRFGHSNKRERFETMASATSTGMIWKRRVTCPAATRSLPIRVLYNLMRRGIEWDLLPWCRDRGLPIMAYSPIDHAPSKRGGMLDDPHLKSVAARHGATPIQVALAWLLRQEAVIVIPKASHESHVRENRAAFELMLTDEDLTELDQAFPPPRKKMALEMR